MVIKLNRAKAWISILAHSNPFCLTVSSVSTIGQPRPWSVPHGSMDEAILVLGDGERRKEMDR